MIITELDKRDPSFQHLTEAEVAADGVKVICYARGIRQRTR
jgi:hypothetical protein